MPAIPKESRIRIERHSVGDADGSLMLVGRASKFVTTKFEFNDPP